MRGLIPSLGAGGSLIAAALCALAVVGGMLAFRGDSRGATAAGSGELTLPAGEVRARTNARSAPRGPQTVAASVTSRRAIARPRVRTGPARPVSSTTAPRAPATKPALTAPEAPATKPVVTAPTPAAPPPDRATPSPVPVVDAAAQELPAVVPPGAAQRTVTQALATAQPVVDAAPAPVRAPVEHLADTVEHVAATVDGVTGGLLP